MYKEKGVRVRKNKRDGKRMRSRQVGRNWDKKEFHEQQGPEEQRTGPALCTGPSSKVQKPYKGRVCEKATRKPTIFQSKKRIQLERTVGDMKREEEGAQG